MDEQTEHRVAPGDATRLRHLESILDYNSDWIWEVDAQGVYTYSSPACRVLLGREPGEVVGRTPFDFMPEGEKARVLHLFLRHVEKRESFKGLVNRNMKADGSIVVLETSGVPLFSKQGEFVGYRGIDRDITDISRRFLQLESVYDLSPVGLCVVDGRGRFAMVNAALARMLKVPAALAEGQPVATLMPQLEPLLQAQSQGPADAGREVEIAGRWYHPTIKPLGGEAGDLRSLSVALTDITALKNAKQELSRLNRLLSRHAHEDHLTGLFNRRHLDAALPAEIARARREGAPTSLLMLDIDHFKQYNDRFGHPAGDECLRRVARQLATVVNRRSDCLGRYGGEEFMAILPGTSSEGAQVLARRIQDAMRGLQLPADMRPDWGVTLSAGIATLLDGPGPAAFDADAQARRLLALADRALYAAKAAGRNQIVTQPTLETGAD